MRELWSVPSALVRYTDFRPSVPARQLATLIADLAKTTSLRIDDPLVADVLCRLAPSVDQIIHTGKQANAATAEAAAIAVADDLDREHIVPLLEALGVGRTRITCDAVNAEIEQRRVISNELAALISRVRRPDRQRPHRAA